MSTKIKAPAAWAGYLVYGDSLGMTPAERENARQLIGDGVVNDIERYEDGEPVMPDADGCINYIVHGASNEPALR